MVFVPLDAASLFDRIAVIWIIIGLFLGRYLMIASTNAGRVFGDPSQVGCAIVSVS